MARSRREKTLADYVVIAISPALIMTLVCSLVFFLLIVTYHGKFSGRLHWILFWFVFGAVLIARIAIEDGREYARIYGAVLGVATALVTARFVDDVLLAWCLLGVIWWCARTLTWDCTMIDDQTDASGEGLLDVAGLGATANERSEDSENGDVVQGGRKTADGKRRKPSGFSLKSPADPEISQSWWQGFFWNRSGNSQQSHAPGVWIVYFSLAALPLFGAGQLLLPRKDEALRTYGFQLLWIYVGSALGLLLTTSFLGLRRYLRQRKLKMPIKMTATWLSMGAVLIAAIMVTCLLLPRPNSQYSLTNLIDRLDSRAIQASKYAVLPKGPGEGEGRRLDQKPDQRDDDKADGGSNETKQAGEKKASDKGKTEAKSNDRADAKSESKEKQKGKSDRAAKGDGKNKGDDKRQDQNQGEKHKSEKGDREKSEEKTAAEKQKDQDRPKPAQDQGRAQAAGKAKSQPPEPKAEKQEQQNQVAKGQPQGAQKQAANPPPKTPQAPNSRSWLTAMLGSLGWCLKWIIYGSLALIAAYFLIGNWSRVREFFAKLLDELLKLWNDLWGRKRQQTKADDQVADELDAVPQRPFAAFDDPFATGRAARMSPPELIAYSFEGLQAWGREQNLPRQKQQTPFEFADLLAVRVPAIAREVKLLAQHYGRLAYAGRPPSPDCVTSLERLWRRLKATDFVQPEESVNE